MATKPQETGAGARKWEYLLDFLAIFFVLLAPYLNFVHSNDSLYEIVNLAVIGVFFAVAAGLATLLHWIRSDLLRVAVLAFLLLLFLDIQLFWFHSWILKLAIGALVLGRLSWHGRRHLSLFMSAVFGTMVAATVVLIVWDGTLVSDSNARPRTAGGRPDLPVYVHIILDEFMGPEGFDPAVPSQRAIKREITSYFTGEGFRLFGRAYSPYFYSHDSISAALNMTETNETGKFHETDGLYFALTRNRYFENLQSRGYRINVYQSTFMDFCRSASVDIANCVTYDYRSPTSASLANLSIADKSRVILSMYASLATLSDVALAAYGKVRTAAAALGANLPEWAAWSDKLGPIPVMPTFDALIRDVAAARGGSMFFAHLLIPHSPYSLDSRCRIRRPIMTWENNTLDEDDRPSSGHANTDASRQARYEAYIPQIRCALRKVQELLDALKERGLYDDAIIVVHGDHGSRIVRAEPGIENRPWLVPQDYSDAFLALYAVKAQGVTPGYDPRPASLQDLTRALIQGGMDAPAGPGGRRPPWLFLQPAPSLDLVRVFLRSTPSPELVRVPLPCDLVDDPVGGSETAGAGRPALCPPTAD